MYQLFRKYSINFKNKFESKIKNFDPLICISDFDPIFSKKDKKKYNFGNGNWKITSKIENIWIKNQ